MQLTEPVVEITRVSKVFAAGARKVVALDSVDLTVAGNDYIAVSGRSGSGKSTLLNVLGCLETPTSGRHQVFGRKVNGLADLELSAIRARTFGFVFQSFLLLTELTAEQNVLLALRYGKTPRAERPSRARELLEDVGLSDRLNHRPNSLSGGEQQRVAIARALANDPTVILADEPTGNLDTNTRDEVMALLEAQVDKGTSLVVVSHDDYVLRRADKRQHMEDGRLYNN